MKKKLNGAFAAGTADICAGAIRADIGRKNREDEFHGLTFWTRDV